MPHRCVISSATPRRFSCTPNHPLLGCSDDTVGEGHQVGIETGKATGIGTGSGAGIGTGTGTRTGTDGTMSSCTRFVLAFPSNASPASAPTTGGNDGRNERQNEGRKEGLNEGENERENEGTKVYLHGDLPPLVCPPGLDATVFFSLDTASQQDVVRQYTQPPRQQAPFLSFQGDDMTTTLQTTINNTFNTTSNTALQTMTTAITITITITTTTTTTTTSTTTGGTMQSSPSPREELALRAGDIVFPVPFRVPPVPYEYDTNDPSKATTTTVPWMGQVTPLLRTII